MNYILFDDESRPDLLPFTYTRPLADIRCGIFTMRERWEILINDSACQGETEVKTGSLTEDYLQAAFPASQGDDNLYINGGVFGSRVVMAAIAALQTGQALVKESLLIAARPGLGGHSRKELLATCAELAHVHYLGEALSLKNVWDIFSLNDRALRDDFALITTGRQSAALPDSVLAVGREHIFIEPSAHIYAGCIFNATTGPVYIGKDAEILEGSMIRGPFAACEHSVVKMGAKIYGATTIGPGCKVGGEINNVVLFANSNKGHDGYLGNAVIGEWCNLGADTNCSNLKNNYDEVKIWSARYGKMVPTGLTFCGLLMGDHSKCGINTMFNTGTWVGVSCNIFGGGFPEKYIPSFSWGGSDGMETYQFGKAMETAGRMMARRGKQLTEQELAIQKYLFEQTYEDGIWK